VSGTPVSSGASPLQAARLPSNKNEIPDRRDKCTSVVAGEAGMTPRLTF